MICSLQSSSFKHHKAMFVLLALICSARTKKLLTNQLRHISGGLSPASYRGRPGSLPQQSMYDLW
jgi:hypothetical protein